MSDKTPGAEQTALPPREDSASRSAVRVAHVQGGQFVLTTDTHSAFAQISNGNVITSQTLTPSGVTRIINLSPVKNQTSSLRPSVTSQTIVSALTKNRTNSNIRLQLFPSIDASGQGITPIRPPVKRSLPSTPEKKDSYTYKLQRIMNHRNVRSKIVKEKFNEHLLESYYLEIGGNILDLYQFAKRPRTQQFLAYIKENALDPKDHIEEATNVQSNTPTTAPSATCMDSLPGISHTVLPISVQSVQSSMTQNTSADLIPSKYSNGNNMNVSVGFPIGTNQEHIVEKAKQEAYVVQRINDLQKEGLWSEKRLPKLQEMPRAKAHWDFLLEEMVWLAADFAQERKWKKAAAKKCGRMVQKYFQDKALAAQRAEKAQEQHIRRIAAFCAKEIKIFWSNVEKLVEYKQNTRLEEKRKKALDQHLSFIVDQTEKYSQLLAEGMNKPGFIDNINKSGVTTGETNSNSSSRSNSRGVASDDDFHPSSITTSDDEDTIALEEEPTKEEQSAEVAALQRESEMDLDSFLKELPKDYLINRNDIVLNENDKTESETENAEDTSSDLDERKKLRDSDFEVDLLCDEDDEETIQEQEQVEDSQDHQQEIEDLKAENDISIEELKKKYANLPNVADEVDNISDVSSENSKSDDSEMSLTELDESDSENTYSNFFNDQKTDDVGLEFLFDSATDSQNEGEEKKTDNNDLINDAAAIAESIQPKGNTLSSTSVVTPVPFLLKLPLREYQHIGLDWLVTMFERKLNGILADEMGLGKTIQTIALLAHLACEKENWGPHLIIVPTSVMLNWEMECKKWCPAFKILTYYGTQKERKLKRTGWTKPNAFHICITSYKLVIQDHQSFRRKKWRYLILDEAQNIKNFKSQRWQLLLNFQTQQRLLLTGTPLQNNLMELWSLMHFLMPHVFQSHREFKEWFSNPVTGMIEGNSEYNESIIKRLHKVLRPFLLRRLKSEVEKQMPKKYEHVIMCRLSKRQRYLYDDYMSRSKTRETLASGNLLSVINVLMQLRKVCNHPNLFEVRPTISPFHCEGITTQIPSIIYDMFEYDPLKQINCSSLNLCLREMEYYLSAYQCYRMRQYEPAKKLMEEMNLEEFNPPDCPPARLSIHVRKVDAAKDMKPETKAEVNSKSNPVLQTTSMKLKMGPSIQFAQQGIQVPTTSTGQSGININVSSMLKPSEKITVPAGFAQLVQTSTGKHILFTPSSCIPTSNLAVGSATVMTSTGQRLTVLSPSVVTNTNSAPQSIAKALVKVQLTSVSAATTSTVSTASPEIKIDDRISLQARTVSSKYLEKLYANQLNKKESDVRWTNNSEEKVHSDDIKSGSTDSKKHNIDFLHNINSRRCNAVPLYGLDFRDAVKVTIASTKSHWTNGRLHCMNVHHLKNVDNTSNCLRNLVCQPADRMEQLKDVFNRFIVYVPAVHAPEIDLQVWHPSPSIYWGRKHTKQTLIKSLSKPTTLLHPIVSAMVTQFPHPRLIQYDCGKLQILDKLLRKLKSESHRVLIFTQMTKMLDVLEAFLNFHGHIYLRLDGTTKVDQRQMLMERFNGDTRIFAFILSTRSGGIGVNLTGADTVIFYDSDWNPTMDAQAQDRCHRIGQTRDVHIYRLISERTIEENILKKANQKRLLGDLAIEGGNFTTAYFKSTTIQDLFNIDASEDTTTVKASHLSDLNKDNEKHQSVEASFIPTPAADDKIAIGALENALATCEDDQDVQAANTAKAEAVADLAEFDENIPLDDQDKEKEPDISKAEQEVENLIKQLTPIERYAMRFIEETETTWSAEQLAAAEREIEEQKLEWERNRLAAMQEEQERRAREIEEENELLTFSKEDAANQVWVSDNSTEQMPIWCPPTPPQQHTDVYVDQTMSFLYDTNIMTEIQLPPVYVKKEAKRTRHEAGLIDSRRALKIHRRDESVYAPRSLFERPSPALVKMRRDIKLQKYRGIVRPPVPIPGMKLTISKPSVDPPCFHNWTIHEDMALLKVIQSFQGLPLNLMILTPGHTPNWDFVADYINTVSIAYRSPKQCRSRYETVLISREEGKQVFDSSPRKKKIKTSMYRYPAQNKSSRPMRTSQLYTQDNNSSFSQTFVQRYDTLKGIASKRTSNTKTVINNPLLKNPKHTAVLNECGIDLDHPILPVEVAARRAERIAREKKTPEQQLAAQRLLIKGALSAAQGQSTTSQSSLTTPICANATVQIISSPVTQVAIVQTTSVSTTTTTTVITTPGTSPNAVKTQRIVSSPLQTQSVVSMSSISPAQLQAATQRLIVSGATGQTKAVVGSTATVAGKTISPAQLQMIRQATLKQQQLRLQSGGITAQTVKTTNVTVGGQPTVQVQFTQAQPRTQYVKPGTVTVTGKQGATRTVTENEMNQLLKRQQQLQQQKTLATAVGSNQTTTIQSISPQGFAQAIQQASSSGTQVATLVKAVSSSGVTQTVTIPVTGVTIGQVKALAPGSIKATNPQQLRQLHIQQQLLAQKKLNQKITGIAHVTGKTGVATQLIVGSKPFSSPITMQQFQQVIRSPLTVQPGPVVLAKGTPRVIPVNASAQGTKPTIQVVAATSQGITTTIRPQSSSTLAGALTGIKVQGSAAPVQQATLLSQVSAALQGQNVNVRQNSPVRIQTGNVTPIVAVSVQSNSNMQQGSSSQSGNIDKVDQVSRLLKK